MSPTMIPNHYAVAMGVNALAAILFGRWFDKIGLSVLLVVALVSAFFAPLVCRWLMAMGDWWGYLVE